MGEYRHYACSGNALAHLPGNESALSAEEQLAQAAATAGMPSWCHYVPIEYRHYACSGNALAQLPGNESSLSAEEQLAQAAATPGMPSWCHYVPIEYRHYACLGHVSTANLAQQLVQESSAPAPEETELP